MGVVYRGHDLVMQRQVAVKLVRTREGVRIDEAITGRFLREAKHTARIQHENIVDVFDLGRGEDGDLFFVMELLEGQTLSQVLQTQERIAPELAVHVGAQIADALEAAHRGGIVHRDLKPANVMLLERGQDPAFVKVLDFGVAKAHAAGEAETALTRTGVLVGTIDYMAPEQILGKKIDGRTDIYSLGVVLYRSITGSNPFRDALMPAMINNHLNVMPEPMASRLPPGTVTRALDRVVEKCMRKAPEERFETMADVSRALRASLKKDPTADLPELGVSGESDADLGADPYEDSYSDDARTRVQRTNKTAVTMVKKGAPTSREDSATAITEDVPRSEPRPEAMPTPPVERRAALVARVPVTVVEASRLRSEQEASRLRSEQEASRLRSEGEAPKPREDSDSLPVLGTSDEHDELSGLKTQVEHGKMCAMCNTANLRAASHCVACGVGLHTVEQAAVRARVTPGERDQTKRMTAFPSVQALPPGRGSAPRQPQTQPLQAASAQPAPLRPQPAFQAQPAQMPAFQPIESGQGQPVQSAPVPSAIVQGPPPPPPSQVSGGPEGMWARMLRWAGLKG